MLTIIGDVHQKYSQYRKITETYEYTLQLGDLGFDYSPISDIDHEKHKWFKGNHDHPKMLNYPHCLGKFGFRTHGDVDFFFVGGGFSVDLAYRRPFVDWFPDEEINYTEMIECKKEYLNIKPDIVITHEPPVMFKEKSLVNSRNCSLLKSCGFLEDFNSNTSMFLQDLYENYKPKLFICGHFHQDISYIANKTKFICLSELGTISIDNNCQTYV